MNSTVVRTADELVKAVSDAATDIRVEGIIQGMPMITLAPGASLAGGTLRFGAAGIRLTADNTLTDVRVECPDHEVAVGNDTTGRANLGTITLTDVETIGQVLLVADREVRAGTFAINGLTITRADVRGRSERPHGFGVDALQGALTIWNRQPDPNSVLFATITGVSAGTQTHPIRGSGVFVGGHGDHEGKSTGGRVSMDTLVTGRICTDGGIAEGTPDLISGGVFVQVGATVDTVRNTGPVTTYGPNDMVLDNWGEVGEWIAEAAVTSRGPSGIGFVNFGELNRLVIDAPLETHGRGARGFNLYDGRLDSATFHSVRTNADGAVGIQITKPLPELIVTHDLRTAGGEGTSLVRGKQVTPKAIALSIKPGGSIDTLRIGGQLKTTGDNVVSAELHGPIAHADVAGGISAEGRGSDAAHICGDAAVLDNISLSADEGRTLVTVDT